MQQLTVSNLFQNSGCLAKPPVTIHSSSVYTPQSQGPYEQSSQQVHGRRWSPAYYWSNTSIGEWGYSSVGGLVSGDVVVWGTGEWGRSSVGHW